jgi:hypothetical protein
MSSHPPERAVASMVSAKRARSARRGARTCAAAQRELHVARAELHRVVEFANSRLSHTLTALRLREASWPMRTPSGL